MKPCARVVYPYPHPDSNPTLANLAAELGRRGWDVELLCAGADVRGLGAPGSGLGPAGRPGLLNPLPRGGAGPGARLADRLRRAAGPALLARSRRPGVLLGADPQGLALARKLGARARLPLVYLSFEILFREEVGPAEAGLKAAELAACADVALTLVQDEERAAALAGATGLPRAAMALVPNAPAPGPEAQPVPPSDLLRRRLGIAPERRIVLYTGSLAGWASLHLLREMVGHWPGEFVLVLHSRAASGPRMRSWLEGLRATGRVEISPDPLPAGELGALYASADFLLAPYMPVPDDWTSCANIAHLGLSSGKVAHAALCGLPILASDLEVFRREFAAYRCGEVYTRLEQTGGLLARMAADREAYSAGARRFYAERLDPRGPMAAFCDRLEGLLP